MNVSIQTQHGSLFVFLLSHLSIMQLTQTTANQAPSKLRPYYNLDLVLDHVEGPLYRSICMSCYYRNNVLERAH